MPDFHREYSLGDITGLYGIMIGESWSYELLTAGQLANLRITVGFAAPNVRTNIEQATALDAFSSRSQFRMHRLKELDRRAPCQCKRDACVIYESLLARSRPDRNSDFLLKGFDTTSLRY